MTCAWAGIEVLSICRTQAGEESLSGGVGVSQGLQDAVDVLVALDAHAVQQDDNLHMHQHSQQSNSTTHHFACYTSYRGG